MSRPQQSLYRFTVFPTVRVQALIASLQKKSTKNSNDPPPPDTVGSMSLLLLGPLTCFVDDGDVWRSSFLPQLLTVSVFPTLSLLVIHSNLFKVLSCNWLIAWRHSESKIEEIPVKSRDCLVKNNCAVKLNASITFNHLYSCSSNYGYISLFQSLSQKIIDPTSQICYWIVKLKKIASFLLTER